MRNSVPNELFGLILQDNLKKKVTWLPPIPWQLKIPTFSFSFLAMLSRHWFVSTFLIWEWRAHHQRLLFLEENKVPIKAHQHQFSQIYTRGYIKEMQNMGTMRQHCLRLKLPSKSYQVTEPMFVSLLSFKEPLSRGLFFAQRLSYNRMDTTESPAQNLQKF